MTELSEGREIRFHVSMAMSEKVKKAAADDNRTVAAWMRQVLKDVLGIRYDSEIKGKVRDE